MNYKRLSANFISLSSVDSTNNYAANLVKETNVVNGTTILTKRQYSGKGQRGNSWLSEDEKNLIFSVVLFPSITFERVFYLNIMASLAIAKTLKDLGLAVKVKWPNDILIGDKKVAGILIENQLQGQLIKHSIVGIGLNVNQKEFPKEIKATSLFLEMGVEQELEIVFNQFFKYLDFYYDLLEQGNYKVLLSRYYESLYRYQQWSRYSTNETEFFGKIKGIDETGLLIVQTENTVKKFDLKEIAFLR